MYRYKYKCILMRLHQNQISALKKNAYKKKCFKSIQTGRASNEVVQLELLTTLLEIHRLEIGQPNPPQTKK